MRQVKLKEQITAVRQLLRDTRKREAVWKPTGEEGTFRLERADSSVVLSRNDNGRVQLLFMTTHRPEWDVEIAQLERDAEPTLDEETRDGLLSLLYSDITHGPDGAEPNALTHFFGEALED